MLFVGIFLLCSEDDEENRRWGGPKKSVSKDVNLECSFNFHESLCDDQRCGMEHENAAAVNEGDHPPQQM
jgi:hypothetical protein